MSDKELKVCPFCKLAMTELNDGDFGHDGDVNDCILRGQLFHADERIIWNTRPPPESPLVGVDFNLEELKKDWEDAFYDGKWEVDTLKLTGLEKQIITAMCDFLPRHMPEYDWNLPYAEAIILLIRRALAAKFESPLVGTDKRSLASFISTFKSKRGEHFAGYQSLVDELSEAILAKLGSPQKIHACKCRKGQEGAITVRRLDDGLYECPRCGGIIVPKPDPRFVEVGKIELPKKLTHINQVPPMDSTMRACGYFDGWNNAIYACKAAVEKAKGQK